MTFSKPVFINIGDEYDKKILTDSRPKGPAFTVGCSKVPSKLKSNVTTLDGLFEKKILRLSEGERYTNPKPNNAQKNCSTADEQQLKPFVHSSPGKKSCGLGSYFGCFESKPKHEVSYDPTNKSYTKALLPPLKNIYTNPPKKGCAGYPNRSISKADPKYISSFYTDQDNNPHLKKIDIKDHRSQSVIGQPFKTSGCSKNYFTQTLHGISKIYTIDKPIPKTINVTRPTKTVSDQTWKPSGVNHKIIGCPIKYLEDPLDDKEFKIRAEILKKRNLYPWKPSSGIKSMPTKNIKIIL